MVLKLKKVNEETEVPQIEAPQVTVAASAASVENSNELPIGTELQGYRIIQKLGSGGMGTVYLADQKSMQRKVALKILNPSVTKDAASVEQFLNETRNTGQIHHPNIVNAFDAGCENGVYFLAMQYIKGDTLDHILQVSGAMDEINALEIMVQIAGALSHVWSKYKMFHRDIKPGNIMLDRDENKAMLMDLGIAQIQGEGNCGNDDCVEGSPFYMSPEQIQGKNLSWTSDLYSLGATLYQLIVGVPPYDDKTIEDILKMHCQADFPEPAERNPGCKISMETVALLKKMMNKSPNKRFVSWEAFIVELNNLIALLKEYKEHPGKQTVRNAMALAEEKRNKLKQSKKKSAKITAVIFASVAVLCVAGYFITARLNTASAKAYLENGTGGKTSKLQDAFEKFKADPSSIDALNKTLKEAEITADSIGVPSDVSESIRTQVSNLRKESEELFNSSESFKKFAADFGKRRKEIEEKQAAFNSGRIPKKEDCKRIADLIGNLEAVTNVQNPKLRSQIVQLNQFKSAVEVMQGTAKKNYERLKKYENAKADEEGRRNLANALSIPSSETFDFSDVKDKVRGEVNAAENNKRNAARQRQEQDAKALNAARLQANKSVVSGSPKPIRIQMPNGADAVTTIRKDTANLKKLFFNAFYNVDIEAGYSIKLNPLYDQLPQTPEIKKELAALKAEYNKCRAPFVKGYAVWKELNNLDNLNYFQQMTVRTTSANQSLEKNYLTIAKIVNGNVHFLEPGSVEVPFIELLIGDKNNIVRKLFSVKKFDQDTAYSFCHLTGLYEVAYEVVPKSARTKVINEAKTTVRSLYNEARKRSDFATMKRLERDYKHWKIMKGIIR